MPGGGSLLGVSVLELRTDQTQLDRGLREAQVKTDAAGATMAKTMDRRMVSMGSSMSKAGSSMTKWLTVPLAGVGLAAAKLASDFDAAMERVHTQAGASQQEVDKLRQSVLNLAKTSGQSPTALAEGLYHLESIGLRGAKAMDALKIAAEGAAVGGSDLEDTATALGSAWLVNIKGAGNLSQIMGELNATVGAGNMRMGDLVEALGTGILPAAKLAGLSLQDVSGAIAVLSDEGTGASRAANLLRTSLSFLEHPSTKAQGALAQIGLEQNSLALDMQKPRGLLTALTDLKDHLDSTFPANSGRPLSVEQMADATAKFKTQLEAAGETGAKLNTAVEGYKENLKTMGSSAVAQEQILGALFPAGRGWVLQTLLNQLDRYQMKLNQIDHTSKNFAQDVTATQHTAAFRMHQDLDTIEKDLIQVGDKLLPTLLSMGTTAVNEVDKLVTSFSKLPQGAQSMILDGGLVVAAIGPALKLAGVFTSGIGRLWQAASIANKLAGGQTLSQALGRTPATTAAATEAARTVGTMEVGTLIVRSMIGGVPGAAPVEDTGTPGVLPIGSTAASETTAADSVVTDATLATADTALVSRLGAGLSMTLGRVMQGGMVALGGTLAAQLAGQLTGSHAVAHIGTDTALGAAIGTAIEPGLGTAIGGLGGAIVGSITQLASHENYGTRKADSLTSGFGGADRSSLQELIKRDSDAMAQLTARMRTVTKTTEGRFGPSGTMTTQEQVHLNLDALSVAQRQKYIALARQEGSAIAKNLEAGWNAYKLQDEPTMLTQLKAEIRKMPPYAQAQATEMTVKFAQTLEKEKRLPAGAAQNLLKGIEAQFPAMRQYLQQQGVLGVQTLGKALNLQSVDTQFRSQIGKIANTFPPLRQAMKDAGADVSKQADAMVVALHLMENSGFGPQTKLARQDLAQLQDATAQHFSAMLKVVQADMASMTSSVQSGSASSLAAVQSNYSKISAQVYAAMSSGVLTTSQGTLDIAKALNAALVGFGAKPLPLPQAIALAKYQNAGHTGSSTVAGTNPNPGTSSSINSGTTAATGGLFQIGKPGERGRDTVPLNVGGYPIVVGRGEKVAVFNHDQQTVMDGALGAQGYAGLNGMFSKVKRPHYMATGGMVPGFATGGTFSYAQLEGLWDKAGGAPNMAALMAAIADAESSGNQYAHNASGASGLWQIMMPINAGYVPGGEANVYNPLDNAIAAVKILASQGLGAWATYTSGAYKQFLQGAVPPNLKNLAGGAGGGPAPISVKDLVAPQVQGSGTLTTIAQHGLDTDTKAANAYLHKQAAKINAQNAASGTGVTGASTTGSNASSYPNLPSGLGTFQGLPVDGWIVPVLQWAASHGWTGHITSGYRPPNEVVSNPEGLVAPQGQSNHNIIGYPGGAVDVGDPADRTDGQALENVIARYPNKPNLIWGGPVIGDWGHFSWNGHALGGLVQMMASGGLVKGQDSESPSTMSPDAGWVASYADTGGKPFQQLASMFPKAQKVSISSTPGNMIPADIYDIEAQGGGHTVGETIHAILTGLTKGVYGGATDIASVVAGIGSKASSAVKWLAEWPSHSGSLPPSGYVPGVPGGYDAHQYAGNVNFGRGLVDLDVAAPSFFEKLGKAPASISAPTVGKHPKRQKPSHSADPGPAPTGNGPTTSPAFQKGLAKLNALLYQSGGGSGGSGDGRLAAMMDYTSTSDDQWVAAYSAANPDLDTSTGIVTPSDGSKPYVDNQFVSQRLAQFQQLFGWQMTIRSDLQSALLQIPGLMKKIQAAIKIQEAKIKAVRGQIQANVKKINKMTASETANDDRLSSLDSAINSGDTTPATASDLQQALKEAKAIVVASDADGGVDATEQAAKDQLVKDIEAKIAQQKSGKKVHLSSLKNDLTAIQNEDAKRKTALGKSISGLEKQNEGLGGDQTSVGTGGQIGRLNTGLTSLQNKLKDLTGEKSAITGPFGVNGLLDQAKLAVEPGSTLMLEIGALSPGTVQKDLQTALSTWDQNQTSASTTDDSELTSLLEQWKASQTLTSTVESAQSPILEMSEFNLPEFGGSFSRGGYVPGAPGAERVIIAHGGEKITDRQHSGNGDPTIVVENRHYWEGGREMKGFVRSEFESYTRSAARTVRRRSPGGGGGRLTTTKRN